MAEVIIKKDHSRGVWEVFEDGFYLTWMEGKAGDIIRDLQQVKTFDADTKFGIRASDLGPAVAYECAIQGYGDILWMNK